MGCRLDACQHSYHKYCATQAGCTFYPGQYLIACKTHAHLYSSDAPAGGCGPLPILFLAASQLPQVACSQQPCSGAILGIQTRNPHVRKELWLSVMVRHVRRHGDAAVQIADTDKALCHSLNPACSSLECLKCDAVHADPSALTEHNCCYGRMNFTLANFGSIMFQQIWQLWWGISCPGTFTDAYLVLSLADSSAYDCHNCREAQSLGS